jgi:hypothetical protein
VRGYRRFLAAILMAFGFATVTAVPASARDFFTSSLEIRISGANQESRDFIAVASEDRRGADELLRQIGGAMHGPAHFIEEAAATLPHYRVALIQLAFGSFATFWPRTPGLTFVYYPGGAGASFLMVEYSEGNTALEDRWIEPAPAVKTMFQRHLQGLRPISLALQTEAADRGAVTAPWGVAVGAVLLAALATMLFEDRRRWEMSLKRSAGRGTNRRS